MSGVTVAVVVALVAVAIGTAPLSVRGGGGPTGSFRIEQDRVGDLALYGPIVAVTDGERYRGYEIETGDRRWQSSRCEGAGRAGATASQEEDTLVVRCGDEIRGLDLLTGEFLWRYDPGDSWTMLRVGGGVVAIALTDHADVVDLATGERRFRWDGEHVQEQELILMVAGNLLVIGEDDQLIALGPDGRERWRQDAVAPGSIWVTGDRFVTRRQEAVDSYRGADGTWISGFETNSAVRNSMFVADDAGVAVVARNDGESSGVYGLDLERWTMDWKRPGARFASAASRHVAFYDVDGRCRVVRIRAPKQRTDCSTAGQQTVAVTLDDGRVAYATVEAGRLHTRVVVRDL
ncbi:MAG: outer membrane protein assembly factor BamB family protein [Aquihabitans sp.]